MLRALIDARGSIALGIAALSGTWGMRAYPFASDNVFLAVVAVRTPTVYEMIVYGYYALWFTTPFLLASLGTSLATMLVYGRTPTSRVRPLPPYPQPDTRHAPSIVLGETHHATRPGRAPTPSWLTIPQRGLYTGVLVVGAVGSGKTSACMYPFVDQLLRWRAGDRDRRVGGLVMEVKGDFCHQVRRILKNAGREDDYIEIGLESGTSYNPLHNQLDPYAVAYAIASVVNNLFGRSKEPFWQQAYTDTVRFVISLRRIAAGYTTLAEVYHYIIDDGQIDKTIRALKTELDQAPHVIAIPRHDYELAVSRAPWTLWVPLTASEMAHPYDAELEGYLADQGVHFEVRTGANAMSADRRHRLEAISRWYYSTWTKLDGRVRASIVEGIAVYLSLFDENPQVHRAFCPPRAAYARTPPPGAPVPLPPLDELVEAGRVLALNFPMGLNPALSRGLGVMLKLDFYGAMLQRIPRMAAAPGRIFRDVLMVLDECQGHATAGETDPTGDERGLPLLRQAKLIPIFATQSVSSLRSALSGDETWRTFLQCFRTKVFLATADEFTARIAAELCGRADKLKARYALAEAGQGTHISWLSGRATAPRQTITASKSYSLESDYLFPPRAFMELQNAEAIVMPYDGVNPRRPQYVYLKPHHLDVQTSYFDHLDAGVL